ncbi:SDR family oxidoreductase [Burkholderia multivorans]|uniref:SDR family NAD(P)-dependent oxidoreductase n=1 Tax=Burkholderia multivorans TaxID=87883 RepID=UPI0012DF88AA|nr:SDR family NAD(P)-dependent oxidoreductase [Burkholderia multivorans]MBU9232804.1 SDR family oxidoreductase [Burkholderia multivorans]MBU9628081.1 SDR family oxidoreductase [Burkholderia multivorans]QGR89522.1 SDR family NAD(P)-dependent oxidoreductase [Burkholderia multivorans]HEF4735057.1 SDR family oxidoreductase [Burkholderia multivorans]
MMKVAIVTGGTRGIGRAIVDALIADGHTVYFTYRSNPELADALERAHDGAARGFRVDGADWNAVQAFADYVNQEAAVDVLVNNAGVNDDALLIGSPFSRYWETLQINLGGAMAFCHVFGEGMQSRRRGAIVNVSSVAARKPKAGNGAYGASKAAIERFTKTLALEMARFGVRVNAVAPGFVRSDLFERFLASQDAAAFYRQIPMRRILEPEQVARTVLLLANGTIATTGSVVDLGNGENISG